jgi:putative colanic acid biosynthesis glycosyltransferase
MISAMTTSPLFSIVTITRNNLAGLRRTEESLAAQSFRDFEWIVIDGDSTDGTKDRLPQGAVSEPDNGIYDAMNKGIDRATGEYILFLNAGDTLSDPDILATVAKTVAAENPDFIYGDALETGGFYKKARHHQKIDMGMFTHHQAMLYRRQKIGFLKYDASYKIAGDYAFSHAFLLNAGNTSYIPAAICIFETGGVSQRNMRLGRIEQYKARRMAGCAMFKNMTVFIFQTISANLKHHSPRFYSALKAKISF